MKYKKFQFEEVRGIDLLKMLDLVPQTGEENIRATMPRLILSDLDNLVQAQNELLRVSPRHFEHLVAELLKADGYDDVKIIKRVNAPGPDIIAFCDGPTGQKQCYIIECKKWKDAVGLDVVRNLMYRVDTEFRASGGIIVTTSRFTKDAIEEAQKFHKWRLTLKDGKDTINWIKGMPLHKEFLGKDEDRYSRFIRIPRGDALFSFLSRQIYDYKFNISAHKCNACAGQVWCGGANVGYGNTCTYAFSFFHLCEECLSLKIREFESNQLVNNCPFCGNELGYSFDRTGKVIL